ncbi:hypothetical protein Pcinc_032751 [Petrolisthes cinctipes]|uniref:Uncharacterized protein n=1 Tax=Petrolisthes cinctipes TaxID=88211 RepID=A0AAE1ETE5_PETCI|nr:hypothetical protein Pcinc_032751 [Petrolisthes cinctipes]
MRKEAERKIVQKMKQSRMVRKAELEKAERQKEQFSKMMSELGQEGQRKATSDRNNNATTTEVTQSTCVQEEPNLTSNDTPSPIPTLIDLPSNDPTNATTTTSPTTTTKDEDFPYCLLHLPAGDLHKPVLVVMRESDAHKLLQGPYFSKVTTE